jgi:hypothetical protein
MLQQKRTEPISNAGLMRNVGGGIAAFSLGIGLLILYAIPSSCSAVIGLQLLVLGFLFIGGILAFLIGQVLVWKNRKGS